MPVAKPSTPADWATSAAGSDMTAPSAGKQAAGWISGESPAHNFFNWWQNLVGAWTDYLNDLANQVFTWTARHTFSAGLNASASGGGNSALQGTGTSGAQAAQLDGNVTISGTLTAGPITAGAITAGPITTFGIEINPVFVAGDVNGGTLQNGFAFAAAKPKLCAWRSPNGEVRLQGYAVTPNSLTGPVNVWQLPPLFFSGSGQSFVFPCAIGDFSIGGYALGKATINASGMLSIDYFPGLNNGGSHPNSIEIDITLRLSIPSGP